MAVSFMYTQHTNDKDFMLIDAVVEKSIYHN